MGSTCEELCWVLTHILSLASSHGTDPSRMSCERSLSPAHTPRVSAGQGAPRGPSWGQALFCYSHMPRLWLVSQNPSRFRQTFQPHRADCKGQTVRTQSLAAARRRAAAFTLSNLLQVLNRGAQGSFWLNPLPRPVRSMPGIPWSPGSQAEPSPSQFYYWVIKKSESVWIATVPLGWLTLLPLHVYCSNKSLNASCKCYLS